MAFWELLMIAAALSMDAFAVAICKGLATPRKDYRLAVVTGVFFGGFQALMPLVGYLLGVRFRQYIEVIDHWIAFALLGAIGLHMIRDAKEACEVGAASFDLKEMLLLSVATSIDALAVGVTFAFLGIKIVPAVTTIGLSTFLISGCGVLLGNLFGTRFKSKAQIAGGAVLCGMGLKILLEHLLG